MALRVRPGPAALLVLLALGGGASACWFERRPEAANDGTAAAPGSDTAAASPATARDSVRAAVQGFEDAVGAGDQSRAVRLLHERATLYDEESGSRWDPSQADSLLPRPLLRPGDQLQWSLLESSTTVFGDAALVVNRYRATISGEGTPWTATETYVLIRGAAGWRIRHLHRSRGLGAT